MISNFHFQSSPSPNYRRYLRNLVLFINIKELTRSTGMPQVTIHSGITTREGHEEKLTEYLCDWPGCPNIATQVVGCVKELGVVSAFCKEHAGKRLT